jgi:NAD-dependent deacetylase
MLREVAEMLRGARALTVLTGAGMSAESGVPTFRGHEGLWRSFRPEDLATPEAFARDPELVWEWYRWRRDRIAAAYPNDGHHALARLEARVADFVLVTQNVDGLHLAAGSRTIIELHGNIWRVRCTREPFRVWDQRPRERAAVRPAPSDPAHPGSCVPRCDCGARLRPDVVWFGEGLDPSDLERAFAAARRCDVLLVVGTSSVVYPAAALPAAAREAGARVVEINVEATPLSAAADIVLRGRCGEILPALDRLLAVEGGGARHRPADG